MMEALLKARGLSWRRRKNGLVAFWARTKKAARLNYPIKTQRVWSGTAPTLADKEAILLACRRLDREMKDWIRDPRQRRPKHHAVRSGFVYFAQCGETIKIGFSADVSRRISSLQTGSGNPITLLGTVSATPDRERVIHGMFKSLRIDREWFRATPELLAYIAENASETKGSNATRTLRTRGV